VAIEAPDLILLDVKMPDMDGYEVCRRLKSDEQTRNIPLIFISGLDDVVDKVKGFGAGGVDYITKPFDPEDLLARIETHLQLRRLQKQLEEQNLRLQKEVVEWERVEEALQKAHCEMEVRVAERTAELAQANASLRVEVAERKRAEEELRKVNRTLRMLSDCNQTVVRARDERALLQDIFRIIVEIGSYAMAWVGFSEQDEENSVRPVACAGHEEGYLEAVRLTWGDAGPGLDPIGTAIRTGKATICQNMAGDQAAGPWRAQAVKRNYQCAIAIPLEFNGHVLGALGIYAAEPEVFDPAEVNLLTELAGDLAYGVVTLRAHEERKRAAFPCSQE
jgi:DNA-binding response OmpR family regulator